MTGRFRPLPACMLVVGSLFLVCGAALHPSPAKNASLQAAEVAKLTIDYPLPGSIFPPEITPPTFLWHDSSAATHWVVEISYGHHAADTLHIDAAGDFLQPGPIDARAGAKLEWSDEEKTSRTWKPDAETWNHIKELSSKDRATVKITGYATRDTTQPVSSGVTTLTTSTDPVGAPVFYRDVPLMIAPLVGPGAIQPLPPSALPLIKWELRYIGQPASHTVMQNLPTCANCHSFSLDGKTMGLDMDGPRNDKGLYALISTSKDMVITNHDMLRWASFKEEGVVIPSDPTVKRFGFMSQVSPTGQYVITSIAPPGTKDTHGADAPGFAAGVVNRLFSQNYQNLTFTQVFFPTRGILAYYDRTTKKLLPLPGADDPAYVQTSAFWSPDGKYLIYSRAKAQDPFPPGAPRPTYANDPREPLVQYDLYKIPFNGGHGGKAVPVLGASHNGMSNNFPKVSPDGKWIVWVQNRTGLLMRPDSHLYMVPFNGGKPRLMNCNTPRMNSWHTFSPNGRWLAFSSKGRSPYTQLMLTHIDANGNDSPAVIVDNTTAANRAVNIPEFVNIPSGDLEHIDPQATEFYRLFNEAYAAMEEGQYPQAIQSMRGAVARDPSDPLAHYGLASALSANGEEREALGEYRRACELNPKSSAWLDHLAVSYANTGDTEDAIATWRKSLAIRPNFAPTETDLGTVLFDNGNHEEGMQHLLHAVTLDPNLPDAHNHYGMALAQSGQVDAAIAQIQQAIDLLPTSVEYRFNLGYILESRGDYAGAIPPLEKSVELSQSQNWHCLAELAQAYDKTGRAADAVGAEQKALDLALQAHDEDLAANLRKLLERYQQDSAAKAQNAAPTANQR